MRGQELDGESVSRALNVVETATWSLGSDDVAWGELPDDVRVSDLEGLPQIDELGRELSLAATHMATWCLLAGDRPRAAVFAALAEDVASSPARSLLLQWTWARTSEAPKIEDGRELPPLREQLGSLLRT